MNIILTIFFLSYQLIFRKDANFGTRRAFLFMGMLLAVIIPFFHIDIQTQNSAFLGSVIQLDEILVRPEGVEATSIPAVISLAELAKVLYVCIGAFFFFRLLVFSLGVLFEAKQSKTITYNTGKIHISKKLHASSFFHFIFIDPEQSKGNSFDHILEHELCHARLEHSIDRILAELILSLSWINPISWIYKKAVIVNHEYQADNRVIELGTDQSAYQLSILNQYFGSSHITNQFSNQIKKRILMINLSYKKGSFWKTMMLLPLSALLFMFIACDNQNATEEEVNAYSDEAPAKISKKATEEEIFFIVEEMPHFKDSENDFALDARKFIAKNIQYPAEASKAGAMGKIFVQFIINSDGEIYIPDASSQPPPKNGESVKEVVVVTYRPINADESPDDKYIQLLKEEAIRVVESLPVVVPGKQRGKNVSVAYTMPITFKLQ